MKARIGDKVRLKTGPCAEERGVVTGVRQDVLRVRVNGKEFDALVKSVTNLSLAARKAWQSMPDRRVGRPKGSRVCDRISVTLRIDRELWDRFTAMEFEGTVPDRTAMINDLIRTKLNELERREVKHR